MRNTKLDPITLANIKHTARCPDCDSTVRVTPNDHGPGQHRVEVHHDDACPTLSRLTTADQLHQIAVLRALGQTAEDYARSVYEFAQLMAEDTGTPVRLRTNPYEGLPAYGAQGEPG